MNSPSIDNSIALCIPAFNASAVLPRLLESAHAQSIPFDEIWVHDDASSDGTSESAHEMGAKVIRSDENCGCSAGKNKLLQKIQSHWVHFHDADDELMPQFVEHAKSRIAGENFDILLMEHEQVDGSTGIQISRSDYENSNLLDDPIAFMLTNTVNNAGVYSASFLRSTGGFDEDPAVQYNEDRAFHLRLAEAGARFVIEPYLGSRFYFNSGSMSAASQARCCLGGFEITRRYHQRQPEKYQREIGHMSWRHATCLASYQDWKNARMAVNLALDCHVKTPSDCGLLFGFLAKMNPWGAIWLREKLIRLFKPGLRRENSL